MKLAGSATIDLPSLRRAERLHKLPSKIKSDMLCLLKNQGVAMGVSYPVHVVYSIYVNIIKPCAYIICLIYSMVYSNSILFPYLHHVPESSCKQNKGSRKSAASY